MSDFRFQPWPGTIAITAFLAFCSWLRYVIMQEAKKILGIAIRVARKKKRIT